MYNYIYRTKQGEFQTGNYSEIPWSKLHSPNEETSALIDPYGTKYYFNNGEVHRLIGPAAIFNNEGKWFFLNDKRYEFKDWIHNHPNIDIYLEANGIIEVTEKAIWKLKNL